MYVAHRAWYVSMIMRIRSAIYYYYLLLLIYLTEIKQENVMEKLDL